MTLLISTPRLKKLEALEGLIDNDTGQCLASYAAKVPADRAIVEIGAFKGKSTCYLAEGAKRGLGALVWTVDPWDMPENVTGIHDFAASSTREAFDRQVQAMGLTERITPLQGFSVPTAARWTANPLENGQGGTIGLLYIDGSHLYRDVMADFRAWSPFVVLDGWVIFDDYAGRNVGVRQAADQIKRTYRAFQRWQYPYGLATTRRVK